jgi:Cu(I)/Ag(I) efflux system membrane fusion protein
MARVIRMCLSIWVFSAACSHDAVAAAPPIALEPAAPALGAGSPAQNLVNAYLTAQNQLARDDLGAARKAFDALRQAAQIEALPIVAPLRARLLTSINQAAAAKNLAAARTAFADLSDALLSFFATQTNPLPEALSVASCPMARGGKGAKWVQRGAQIKNPYFGSEMLTCGSVDNTLKPDQKL